MRTAWFLAALAALAPSLAAGASGDNTLGSTRPMVVVLNPGKGAVVGTPFLLQVHVATSAAGGAIASIAYTTDGTAPNCAGTLIAPFAVNGKYNLGTNNFVYETQLSLAAGIKTLRVCARNTSGAVEAPTVSVTVGTTAGDGNLLVRDNSNQICADCHQVQSHTSAITSNKYGSWSTACRDCHVPHGTRNVYLVGEQITPPDYNGATGPKNVYFSVGSSVYAVGGLTVGDSGVIGSAQPDKASYANADNSGPCQVCHTRTQNPNTAAPRFRFSGNTDTHYTGAATNNCANCHSHTKGFAASCTGCHGDAARAGDLGVAPPKDTCGNLTGGRVGAHQVHLTGGPLSNGVPCLNCHINPPAGGHPTYPVCSTNNLQHAIMNWAGISATLLPGDTGGAITPTFDVPTQSCSNYCHGNFKNGNRLNTVTWNGTAACGSCHGIPPGGSHPNNSACGSCHDAAYSTTTVNKALHIDGLVDQSNFSCTSCHGTTGRANGNIAGATYDANQAAAPPADSHGATNTGVLVGQHLSHVNPGSATGVYKPVACIECHPNNAGNLTHSNGVVNFTFAAATGANLGGLTPSFTQGNGTSTATTCTTYCHGATLNAATTLGSVGLTWSWTGAAATCGSCHKAPPGTANHHNAAAITTCNKCHSGTVNTDGTIAIGLALHINGTIDTANLTCTTCHGATLAATGTQDANVGAAPKGAGAPDTYGNTATTSAGVGVHASHVLGTRSRAVQCNACHVVPGTPIHKTGVVTAGTVTFGNLALTGGITTAGYAGAGGSCNATYCHGNLGGGIGTGNVTPSWTAAGTLACNACHGAPPATTSTGHAHPQNSDCGACHTGYTSSSVNAATHVDGTVQYVALSCTTCHGATGRANAGLGGVTYDVNQAAAPPADSHGATNTGVLVGQHLSHVNPATATGVYKPVACSECHVVPGTPLHANGTVSFTFAAATGANLAGYGPTFTQGNGTTVATTCATYCHGASLNAATTRGSVGVTWSWTGAAADCGSCHKAPPTTPNHNNAVGITSCNRCHSSTANADGTIAIALGKHINGTIDVSALTCTSCHGTTARANGNLPLVYDANQAAAPPVDTHGLTNTGVIVGGHIAHSNPATPSAVYKPVACTECHVVPTQPIHANGSVSLTFASATGANLAGFTPGLTAGNGTTIATTCSVYCHGQTLPNAGGTKRTPGWADGPAGGSCGTCHGSPPAIVAGVSPHPQNLACGDCHNTGTANDYTSTSVGPTAMAIHIDGTLQKPAMNCYACHGNGARTAVATLAALVDPDPNALVAVPPKDSSGDTLTTALGVGAHIRHVNDRSLPLKCVGCHTSLPGTGDTSHVNGNSAGTITGMPLNALATQGGGLLPTYAFGTCSNTYCHGAKFAAGVQGTTPTPTWTNTLTCGSCHASPPVDNYHKPAWAPAGNLTTCVNCHGTISPAQNVADASGNIVANGLHVNGTVEIKIQSCDVCHGNPATPTDPLANTATATAAPPRDIQGRTLKSFASVGAHQWHVNGSRSKPVECAECHDMTSILFGTNAFFAHADGVVNITWGNIATNNGTVTPGTYTLGSGSGCSATYCHGNFPGGNGTAASAAWTSAGASPVLGCTACHGNPPAITLHHPLNTTCASCHGTGYSSSAVVHATHVDGQVQKATGCTACHGQLSGYGGIAVASTSLTVAPGYGGTGVDVAGNSATTFAAVGAHAKHLTGTTFRATPIACSECHTVPADGNTAHATGTGTGGARGLLTWGALATGSAWSTIAPTFSGSTTAAGGNVAGNCTNYCHGNFKNGANASMSWTGASTTAACGTCHGLPPTGTHPTLTVGTACSSCHTGYTGTQGGSTWAVDPTTHMNGVLDGGGHAAGWKEPNKHGLAAINQVLVSGEPQGGVNFAGCTSCHTGFGQAGSAGNISSCNACHATPAAVGGTYTTGTYPNHTNWQTECTFCHGGRNGDTQGAPARDTHVISTDLATAQGTTVITVGAHRSHVQGLHSIAQPLACTACHQTLWTSATDAGHVDATTADVFFNNVGLSANPGAYARPTCSANYCHGNFTGSDVAATPAWTGNFGGAFTLNCGSCHGAPPSSSGHAGLAAGDVTTCVGCHSGTVDATGAINVAGGLHINGKLDGGVSSGNTPCLNCHKQGMVLTSTGTLATEGAATLTATYHHVMEADVVITANLTTYPATSVPTTVTSNNDKTCAQCHADHNVFRPDINVNASVTRANNLRTSILTSPPTAATGTTINVAPGASFTNVDAPTAGGGICLSCHTNAQAKDTVNQKSDGTTGTYALDATAFTASRHSFLVAGAISTGSAAFNVNCTKCHSSSSTKYQNGTWRFALHTSVDRRLLNPMGITTPADPLEEKFCYRCHSASTDTSPGGGPAKATTAVDYFGVSAMAGGATDIYRTMTQEGSVSTTAAQRLFLRQQLEGSPIRTQSTDGSVAMSAVGLDTRQGSQTTAGATTKQVVFAGAGTSFIAGFATPPVAATATISAANWTNRVWAKTTAGTVTLRAYAYVWTAAGTKTQIFAPSASGNLTTTSAATTWTSAGSSVSLGVGDRLVYELWAQASAAATVNIYIDGNSATADDSSVTTPTASAGGFSWATGHQIGTWTGVHRPNPSEEHLQRIAANKHSGCTDCHNPHESRAEVLGVGLATAAGTSVTLNANPGTWGSANLTGYTIWIRSAAGTGANAAQHRGTITSNTTTQVTFTPGMGTTASTPVAYNTAINDPYRITLEGRSGTITTVGTNLFTDTTKSPVWPTSAYVGGLVRIIQGTGVGSVGLITANTGTQINVASWSGTVPAAGSLYSINPPTMAQAGASGVDATGFSTNTWGGVVTYTPAAGSTTQLPEAKTQWQVCFKCHSSANTALATWDSNWTDLGKDFNPNNAAYHPIIQALPSTDPGANGSNRLAAGQLINGWTPGSVMTCTDCHNADAASPAAQGPHGSAVQYMLAGINRAWPFTVAGAISGTLYAVGTTTSPGNEFQIGTANGLFCRNCHPANTVTGSSYFHKQYNQDTAHTGRFECVDCHIRVPHGGKVSRLIRTTNTPARYVVPGSGTTSTLTSFTKSATNKDTYTTANWQPNPTIDATTCNTEHTQGAASESW